ncbi:MAG TPA: aminotransferase class V-fold PLP-dependent enzyme [Candidatus Nanopelagicaceae bacterium]|nr:aminotransferase class V-fold PLP-dependent enzyme [Candidatus Nanopelagicaceae bacterium]
MRPETRFDSDQPLHPEAREILLAAFDSGWADPQRIGRDAARARTLLTGAKDSLAANLGVRPDEIYLVGESALAPVLALEGALASRGGRFVTSRVERSEILAIAASRPDSVQISVDRSGSVNLDELEAALLPGTGVVSLQAANGEVGTRQPLDNVADLAEKCQVPLHIDLGAGAGRINLPGNWSYASADARSWSGPAGVGVYAIRTGARWRFPWASSREQREVGTSSIPLALAAAAALEAWQADEQTEGDRNRKFVDQIRLVAAKVADVEVVGDAIERVPNIVTFSALYCDGESLVEEFAREGFVVGSGSACTSDQLQPSHVLAAMGALTHGNIRVTLPHFVSGQDIDRFCELIPVAIANVRKKLMR